MTATRASFKSFSDQPIPAILYVDTSFVVDALIKGQRFHTKSLAFIDTLAKDPKNQPILIFSDLLEVELRCAIISNCIRNDFGKSANVKDILAKDPNLIPKYYSVVEDAKKQLEGILQRFTHWASVRITEEIIEKAGVLMVQYRLGSYDAIHIATMEKWDINDIVVYDGGIEDLPKYKTSCIIWTRKGWAKYIGRESRRKGNKVAEQAIKQAEELVKTEDDKDRVTQVE